MTDVFESLARAAAASMAAEWETMVRLAVVCAKTEGMTDRVSMSVAASAKTGVESVRRKLRGIQHGMTLGYTEEELVSMGQEKVLSQHQQDTRAKKYTDQVSMIFRVQGSQRELVQQEIARVREVLNLDAEQFWDLFISVWSRVGEDELRELSSGGENAERS